MTIPGRESKPRTTNFDENALTIKPPNSLEEEQYIYFIGLQLWCLTALATIA